MILPVVAFVLPLQVAVNQMCALPAPQDEQTVEAEVSSKLRAGRVDDALTEAHLAVGRYPDSAAMNRLLGEVLFKKGMNTEARAAFRRAIQIDPSIPQIYYQLAQVDFSEKSYFDAARNLETFLRLNPDNAEARALLGRTYLNLNQNDAAIVQFRRALALNPVLPLLHYHLGSAYESEGNLKAALKEFRQEVDYNPHFYDSYWRAGNIELGQGNPDAASELFQAGIRVKPLGYQAHYGLGRVLLAQRQLPSAQAELKKVLASNPHFDDAHCVLAQVYQQMGKPQDARVEFDGCAQLNARRQNTPTSPAGQHP
ncbi:MAG TPA: tetratricopeptide repeat protein [Terriglobia bacterium]|nr:tetratricopeptide repeat protein [Terriglobia bacterium]